MKSAIRWTFRSAFIALMLFQIGNLFGVFHVPLDFTWLGLFATTLFGFLVVESSAYILKVHYHARLPAFIWPLAFGLSLIDNFGDIFHFYSQFDWYDQVAHFVASLGTATILYEVFSKMAEKHQWKTPHYFIPFFAFTLTASLGALYEIEEYLEDYFFSTNRLGDGFDTANDLFLNVLGALTIAVIAYLWRRHSTKA